MTNMQFLINNLKADGVHYTRKINEDTTISVFYTDVEDIFDWDGEHIASITWGVDGTAYALQTHNMTQEEVYALERAKTREPMFEALLDDKDTVITMDADDKYYALYDGRVHVFGADWTYLHTLDANGYRTYVIIGEKDGQIFWSYHEFSSDFMAAAEGAMLALYHYGLKNISIVDCYGREIDKI